MGDIAIKFENISKQYRLGEIGTGTLSHDLNRWYHKVRGLEDPYLRIGADNNKKKNTGSEYIFALRDINLEVRHGEIIGIIGKNGAGKSTLLKILSKVTRPTTGIIKTRGRIASLLEVGTGFHPEMTGRENIYMNGSIMGMTKSEITTKFDAIVDFSGVEKFIDTPVKRYSSGMTVRLGFAIAAHLEPEILLVDEVLAVGDVDFQKKALGKMRDVSKTEGRTVLFVSHNMGAIRDLCNSALILSQGIISNLGPVRDMVNLYMGSIKEIDIVRNWEKIEEAPGDNCIRLRRMSTLNEYKKITNYSSTTNTIGIYIEYEVLQNIAFFTHGINLFNSRGDHIFSSHDNNSYINNSLISKGVYYTIVWVPGNLLQHGDYLVSVACMRYNPFQVLFHELNLLRIQVIDTMNQASRPENCNEEFPGLIRPKLNWEERSKI